jgi:hypothetical protein
MDFDARDHDSRDEDRAPARDRDGRAGSDGDDERDDELSRPAVFSRDRDDDARDLGRGPGDSRESHSAERGRDARDDARWPERERDERTRDTDPREAFTCHLNLPRGLERQLVRDHDREYTLRGSESRTLATVGAFRVVRAYERHAERLEARGARIERVILDYELKREYQKWLHERDKDRDDYDGHPDRTADEIREWALEHDLPYFDDEVHIPDLRIEYELDDRLEHRNVEVTTDNYRGAHGASVAKSGFSCYRGSSARIGVGSSRGGGSPFVPDIADEFVQELERFRAGARCGSRDEYA